MKWRRGSPFAKDDRKPKRPYEFDQEKRDAVLKNKFNIKKVSNNLTP
jgi:hypothetical protein